MGQNNQPHWLALRRAELNLKQEDLAYRLQELGIDIKRSTISHWETNQAIVPLHNGKLRRALSTILELSVLEMLSRAGFEVDIPQPITTHAEFITLLDRLKSNDQEAILALIKFLVWVQEGASEERNAFVHLGFGSTSSGVKEQESNFSSLVPSDKQK